MPLTAHSRNNTLILFKNTGRSGEETVRRMGRWLLLGSRLGGGGEGGKEGVDQAWLFFSEALQHYLMLNYMCA